ncbi:MAG TPA: general secretion pathway protein GspB [Nevskiaceae bacterium]|nr:general secretion pathway protein GspB [Nevskiaceae bacterium]
MSYLLEALRRAERERAQGQPPSLQPGATAPSAVEAPRGVRGLTLLLVAMVGVLAGAWLFGAPRTAPAPSAAPTAAAAPPPAPAVTTLRAAPAVPPPALEDNGERTLDDLWEGEAASAAAAPVVEPRPVPAAVTAMVEPVPAPAPAAPSTPAAGEAEPPAVQTGSTPAPAAPLALADLDASTRAELSLPPIDVHVSDADPRRRFILSGGQRLTEGDSLPGGVVLREIVAGGLVVEFRGQRILVPVQ